MSASEHYDIVIVGGGHNGTTTAAYLSKCGLSVCVLEERNEMGGLCETAEPMAGTRIYPHTMLMYASPSPGFEQLELWKYGFRMTWSPIDLITTKTLYGMATTQGPVGLSPKDMMGYMKLSGMVGNPPFVRDLMRAAFWCPPHPPEVEVNADTIPYMQVYKERAPEVWSSEILDMTLFDLMDEWFETEPWKCTAAASAWWVGPAAHWEGVAIPAFLSVILGFLGALSIPRGGMHGYLHSIFRCAVAHGAVFRTCSSVEEIIVRNGRAIGVRLRDDAATKQKVIWAEKAVISACDVKQTFNDLIGKEHLDAAFLKKVNDISLKGGTVWTSHFFLKKHMTWKPKFKAMGEGMEDIPYGCAYPVDSREIYFENVSDVDAWKGNPSVPPERYLWFLTPSQHFDVTDPQHYHPKGHLTAYFGAGVTPPEHHVESLDAIDKVKDKMEAYMRKAFSEVIDGLDDDNIIHHWSAAPYENERRHPSMLGSTWCGSRMCDDQWWVNRPIPELSRYRTPIEGLYLCHQSSAHPGGLCLMAVGYNLMHILIEDGIAEPGGWWYPSPWYIPERGKISAIPTSK